MTKTHSGPGRPRPAWWPAAVLAAAMLLPGCRLLNLERKLDPENAEFLSKVRYIITKDERRIFLELPDSEKPAFREQFWKSRDPDTQTDENEFRTEYFDRLEESDRLFRGEGRPGWLTDRGRIFILFGPPTERLTYPMESQGVCQEIWSYGVFPVIFIDEHCSGHYILSPINLEHLQALNKAQSDFQKSLGPVEDDPERFDYDARVTDFRSSDAGYEARVLIELPYSGIWFAYEDERLKASFPVRMALRDPEGGTLWEFEETFRLELEEAELHRLKGRQYQIEVPLVLPREAEAWRGRAVSLEIVLRGSPEGEARTRTIRFRLDLASEAGLFTGRAAGSSRSRVSRQDRPAAAGGKLMTGSG